MINSYLIDQNNVCLKISEEEKRRPEFKLNN